MSKKNKKKLKKLLRQQARQVARSQQPTDYRQQSSSDSQVTNSDLGQLLQARDGNESSSANDLTSVKTQRLESKKVEATEDIKEVKHEIKKILLTVLALFALILIVYFINIKTDMVLKFGEWATNMLNINV